ncbi:hypothetical protein QTP88_025425 [Uroleucon formosanum]
MDKNNSVVRRNEAFFKKIKTYQRLDKEDEIKEQEKEDETNEQEKELEELQSETTGVEIGQQHIQVLGFADDSNILENSLQETEKAAQTLEQAASKIGLKINAEKTKVMELLEDGDNPNAGSLTFEKVDEFRYLGVMLSAKNDWSREIGVRIAKTERAAFALNKFFKSKLFSKKTKTRLYTAIIRHTHTYGCEAWTTTSITERRLRNFENRIWRTICGPTYDNVNAIWRRNYNKELQDELGMALVISFVRGQRIQWLEYGMRRNEDDISRTILNWKPMGKRPRGRPRKRWMNVVEEDLERLEVQEWREAVQDCEK